MNLFSSLVSWLTADRNTVTIEIPVLVAPDGTAFGTLAHDPGKEIREDKGLLYDDMARISEGRGFDHTDCEMITVEAEVDLDALFDDRTVKGKTQT